jgi:hypothetical protein
MATTTKQTPSKPQPPATVESAEQVLARLQAQREKLTRRQAEHEAERSRLAFAARAEGDAAASKRLSELAAEAVHDDYQLRDYDAAIKEAAGRVEHARQAEARAVDQARVEEARKLISELGACFPYLARKLEEAANALIAIDGGFADLRKLGFTSPTVDMLRLNICAILQTWGQQLPKHIHNELRDGFRFLAPHERKSAVQYWAQIQASIDNQINQRLDKTEQANKERAA